VQAPVAVAATSWALNLAPVPADRGVQPSSAFKFVQDAPCVSAALPINACPVYHAAEAFDSGGDEILEKELAFGLSVGSSLASL
jgi:hypothetical protein